MENILNIKKNQSLVLKQSSVAQTNILKSFGKSGDRVELYVYDLRDNLIHVNTNFSDYSLESGAIPPSSPQYPTNVQPEVVRPDSPGAGETIPGSKLPGPNQATDGYWFNTGKEKIWVSNVPMELQGTNGNLTTEIVVDPIQICKSIGYTTGKFKVKLLLKRDKIFNVKGNPFSIKEISSNRKEIRTITPKIPNNTLSAAVSAFISELESSVYFKEFYLSFGEDINILGINILLNKDTSKYEVLIKTLD